MGRKKREWRHTVGDWEVGTDIGTGIAITVTFQKPSGPQLVGLACYGATMNKGERQANARLMAAGPKLLDALVDLLNTIHVPDEGLEGAALLAYQQAEELLESLKGAAK